MRHVALGLLLLFLASSCRDKGSYAWSGRLIDACEGEVIGDAELTVKTSGEFYTTTGSADGTFQVSGSWNEPCPLGNCKQTPPELTISFPRQGMLQRISLFPPLGRLDFGDLILLDTLEIPLAFTGDTTGWTNKEIRLYVTQDGVSPALQFGESAFLTELPKTIKIARPNAFVTGGNEPQFPFSLFYYANDRSSGIDLDITSQIRRCAVADTVVLAF